MASANGFLQHRVVRTAILLATLGVSTGLGALTAGWSLVCAGNQCPSVDVLELYQPRQTSKLYAADGRFLAELGLERRTVARLQDIPPLVQNAFVYTEDKRFYSHNGIDFIRVFGSVLVNVMRGGYAQGFSTITMQLARNIFPERLERAKSVVRKMREGKVAVIKVVHSTLEDGSWVVRNGLTTSDVVLLNPSSDLRDGDNPGEVVAAQTHASSGGAPPPAASPKLAE